MPRISRVKMNIAKDAVHVIMMNDAPMGVVQGSVLPCMPSLGMSMYLSPKRRA
jgi:hypothetical protein